VKLGIQNPTLPHHLFLTAKKSEEKQVIKDSLLRFPEDEVVGQKVEEKISQHP
jgi:hypothetical protein